MPPELREEAHLMELESMGYTIVHEAIPPQLLKKIKLAHNQAIERIRSSKPEADWSWESDNPGVCDYWRLYQLDPVFEELLTLPSIFNIIKRAFKEGRGRPATDEGIRLMHEMGQHLPAKTPGGQAWHRIRRAPLAPRESCAFYRQKRSCSDCAAMAPPLATRRAALVLLDRQ